jgi:hypothetical protein
MLTRPSRDGEIKIPLVAQAVKLILQLSKIITATECRKKADALQDTNSIQGIDNP